MLDAVLIVLIEYSKFAKYIHFCKDWKAEDMANVLVKVVFTKYDKSIFFVSNHSLLFTSKFCFYLYYYLSIQLGYSTVFHS